MEGNEIYILYQGACGGCPSAMMGTLDAIQSILQHELSNPEVSVIPI
jgi:Fe-S cluster biogenesis protein NfuA